MISDVVAPRPSLNSPSTLPPDPVGLAKCPSCQTEDPSVMNIAVSAGADWQCSRCGSRWNANRVATVAAYEEWLSGHTLIDFPDPFS